MTGTLHDRGNGGFDLELAPYKWNVRPGTSSMIGLKATRDPSTGELTGRLDDPRCGGLRLRRREENER